MLGAVQASQFQKKWKKDIRVENTPNVYTSWGNLHLFVEGVPSFVQIQTDYSFLNTFELIHLVLPLIDFAVTNVFSKVYLFVLSDPAY